MYGRAILLAVAVLAIPAAARAAGPEQLEQAEPAAGKWLFEYQGSFGRDGSRAHSGEAMFGVGGRLALGLELEVEHENGSLHFETVGAKALYRFTDEASPVEVALVLQAGMNSDLRLAEAEARLIASRRSETWWTQGNMMIRRSGDPGSRSVNLAYVASLQHSLGRSAWLGIETSGQSAPLGRQPGARLDHGHFAGPSLTFDWETSDGKEVEVGLAYLWRLAGHASAGTGRLFVQWSF